DRAEALFERSLMRALGAFEKLRARRRAAEPMRATLRDRSRLSPSPLVGEGEWDAGQRRRGPVAARAGGRPERPGPRAPGPSPLTSRPWGDGPGRRAGRRRRVPLGRDPAPPPRADRGGPPRLPGGGRRGSGRPAGV